MTDSWKVDEQRGKAKVKRHDYFCVIFYTHDKFVDCQVALCSCIGYVHLMLRSLLICLVHRLL